MIIVCEVRPKFHSAVQNTINHYYYGKENEKFSNKFWWHNVREFLCF